jgi:hypothetical protein
MTKWNIKMTQWTIKNNHTKTSETKLSVYHVYLIILYREKRSTIIRVPEHPPSSVPSDKSKVKQNWASITSIW